MTVSELLVKCLETEGVTHIFGVPGEENEALLFALRSNSYRAVMNKVLLLLPMYGGV